MRLRFVLRVIAIAGACVAGSVSATFSQTGSLAGDSASLKPWTGDSALPSFTLHDSERRAAALNGGDHAITLVHFFATWCEPCRDELPALQRLVQRSNPAELRVLTISVAEVEARVRNFTEKYPVHLPILLDLDRSVARAWNVSALPTTFVLGRDLKPRLYIEREYDWDTFDLTTAFGNETTTITKGKQP